MLKVPIFHFCHHARLSSEVGTVFQVTSVTAWLMKSRSYIRIPTAVPRQYGGSTAAVPRQYCRRTASGTAAILPPYCRGTAAILCCGTATVLPPYCRRTAAVLIYVFHVLFAIQSLGDVKSSWKCGLYIGRSYKLTMFISRK